MVAGPPGALAGAIGGLIGGVIGGALADPCKPWQDVALAEAIGGAVGGALGPLIGKGLGAAARSLERMLGSIGAGIGTSASGASLPPAVVATVSALSKATQKALTAAGQALDKGGNLTKAGRALQKHASRPGSAFPPFKGAPSAINKQGQQVLDDILNSASQNIKKNRFGGLDIYDNVTKRGVRFDSNNNMMGFLEP